jgi:hypothetical protein
MATPLNRPQLRDTSAWAGAASRAAGDHMDSAAWLGLANVTTALGMLTGLWVALSPLFLMFQHGGGNAAAADLVTGLVVAALGAVTLTSPRGFGVLQLTNLVLGVGVFISSFILGAKFSIAAPMYWSNCFSGALLVVLALATVTTFRRASG